MPLLILISLAACKENKSSDASRDISLFKKPVVVSLDLNSGYKINQLSGDSIKPLINSLGDTIKTGTPFLIQGTSYKFSEYYKVKTSKAVPLSREVIETNYYPVKGKPIVTPVTSFDALNKISAEELLNPAAKNENDDFITTKQIPAVGEYVPLIEPKPVKVMPMRFKDNATHDIQYLDVSQGLSYSYVLDVLEDKKGNIWFGTDGYGLCKYDGIYLTTYTDKNGLAGNNVKTLAEDKNGSLWIGTTNGISVFDGNKFIQFTKQNGLPDNRVDKICRDKNDNFWIMTEGFGITRFDGKDLILYSGKPGMPQIEYGTILHDSKGLIWFGTHDGVTLFDGKRFRTFNYQLSILKTIYAIEEDSKGNIWFGSTFYGLIKYDGKSFTHFTIENGLPDNSIMSMKIDRNDNIWIATRYGGVCKFNGNYFTTYGLKQGMPDDKIINLTKDSQDNIWICTSGGGICKLNESGFSEKIELSYFGNSRVRPMQKDINGNLWFGTEGKGLFKYDGANISNFIGYGEALSGAFRAALTDKKGNLWFGEAEGSGIYKYDYKKFLYYYPSARTSAILSIVEDNKDYIWIGTSAEGIARLYGNDLTYINEKDGFSSNRVFTTIQDKKGNLWFGTENGGLVKYDGKFFTVFTEAQGLFTKSITSIIEDAEGNLWLGTFQAGLCKFDGMHFTYYTVEQGLSFNDIWSIQEDANKYMWVGTDKGLSVLIPQKDSLNNKNGNYRIYSFGQQDGLKTTDFNLKSVCIDNDNRIWWGTGKAVITRDLKIPFKPSSPRSLSISHIEINEQFYNFRNIDSIKNKISYGIVAPFKNYPDKLSLPYNQNHLNFYYSAIDWQAPHKIKYSFRLIGLDKNWSSPSGETNAEFRNLSHGSYELQVKAIGQSQEWTKPISYRFTIRPPWWLTWWFKSISIISLAAIIFLIARFIYRYQLRKQRTAMEKQLAVQMERQRISSEMHDDIGAGLSGVRLLTEMTKSKLKDGDASGEVDKIYQSVGELSAKMKEVIWSLNTDNDSLESLIAYLQKQSRAMMENYPAVFEMKQPETIPDIKVNGDARRHIHLLVKEALHNTIKHSGANNVKLTISYDEVLRIVISDNGKGLNGNTIDNSGNGMKNMRQRIRQLNGVFLMQDKDGLTITFEIPLK